MGWLNAHDKNSGGPEKEKKGESDATTKPMEKLGAMVKDLRSMAASNPTSASAVSHPPSIGEVD
jgi:hypothetical protein